MSDAPPPDRRSHERKPIRLKVVYKSAANLVTEYTKSVSKGGVSLETTRPLPVGTRFVFEMYAAGLPNPVEVEGKVVRSEPCASGEAFDVGIEYTESDEKRMALERVLDRIFADHQWEKTRRFPRVPVNLPASDGRDEKRSWVVRDISLGGLGLRMPGSRKAPGGVAPGTPVLVAVELEHGSTIEIQGEVVWTLEPGSDAVGEASVGVQFEKLSDAEHTLVEVLARLHRPAHIVVTFFTGGPRTR